MYIIYINSTEMKNTNEKVVACKKPMGRVGGTNAPVYAIKNPTRYTGGKNDSAIPKKGQGR
jgi:hypothetical protein